MNSDIKPDFEKMAERICSQWNYHTVDDVDSMKDGMEKIWTDHVEPLLSTVKRLQEENEQLKEALKNAANKARLVTRYKNEPPIYSQTARLSSGAHVMIDKDSILKSSELNKES